MGGTTGTGANGASAEAEKTGGTAAGAARRGAGPAAPGSSASGVGRRRDPAPYPRRLSPEEIAEIVALYRGGMTAKRLSQEFGGSERRIYNHLRAAGALRKQVRGTGVCALSPGEVVEAVRETRGSDADLSCRSLAEDASLGEAARAAATTAINLLRDAEPARAYTYARLAGTLEKLARGAATATERDDPDGTERGRRAALDYLRERGLGV